MRPAKAVKLGEEFLKGISEGELVSMQVMEKDYKVKTMLQAARHRKKGMFLREISEARERYTAGCCGSKTLERRYDRRLQRSVLDREGVPADAKRIAGDTAGSGNSATKEETEKYVKARTWGHA